MQKGGGELCRPTIYVYPRNTLLEGRLALRILDSGAAAVSARSIDVSTSIVQAILRP